MPAEKTSFTATEIKAGVMVLASVVILAAFVAAIRGCGGGGETMNTYSTVFRTIEGLNLGAEVRFGGVKAGKVLEISTDPTSREMIRVRFEVPADVPVNHGSIATIEQIPLTSEKHLTISPSGAAQPLHESGDYLKSSSGGGLFDVPDLEGVTTRLETMLDGINALICVKEA